MRTALLLLLLLAVAAVPGSLVPQRTSDPNGVVLLYRQDPARAQVLEFFQLFNVYTSVWFSAIYLLLFISLIGCVIPRARHHWRALKEQPPRTPSHLTRLPVHSETIVATDVNLDLAAREAFGRLRAKGYRVAYFGLETARPSIAGERGYLRETGNLVFHVSLVGILVSVAIAGGFRYNGQRVIVQGETFTNARAAFDSFTPGQFFSDASLPVFSLTLDQFDVTYVEDDRRNLGFITDYIANVTTRESDGRQSTNVIRVNNPLEVQGVDVFLLGNGYAPEVIVRDPAGGVVFRQRVPFLPQDSNLTSLGVVKVPDGLSEQVGIVGFFYPTKATLPSGAFSSSYPDLINPVMTLNVFVGDLGLNEGTPRSVYVLDTSAMTQLTGGDTTADSIELRPGEIASLPNGLGTVELGNVARFASFDMAYDPTKLPVLVFTLLGVLGLGLGLFVPRRRIWFRFERIDESSVKLEAGALARGEDPALAAALGTATSTVLVALGRGKRDER